jgi:hypothetical protein
MSDTRLSRSDLNKLFPKSMTLRGGATGEDAAPAMGAQDEPTTIETYKPEPFDTPFVQPSFKAPSTQQSFKVPSVQPTNTLIETYESMNQQPSVGSMRAPSSSMPQPSVGSIRASSSSMPQPSVGSIRAPSASLGQPSVGSQMRAPSASLGQPSVGSQMRAPSASLGQPVGSQMRAPSASLGQPVESMRASSAFVPQSSVGLSVSTRQPSTASSVPVGTTVSTRSGVFPQSISISTEQEPPKSTESVRAPSVATSITTNPEDQTELNKTLAQLSAQESIIRENAKQDSKVCECVASIDPEEIMKQYELVTGATMYHVMLDSMWGSFDCTNNADVQQRMRPQYTGISYGKISRNPELSTSLPVVFDLEEAKKLAAKLVSVSTNAGSLGTGSVKHYPYLGAVIVGLRFAEIDARTKLSRRKVGVKTERNYSEAFKDLQDKWLVFYDKDDTSREFKKDDLSGFRGLLSREGLGRTYMQDTMYVMRTKIDPDNAFALLNTLPWLTAENVAFLKCLSNGKQYPCNSDFKFETSMDDNDVKTKYEPVAYGTVAPRASQQLGGAKYDISRKIYINEKARYLYSLRKRNLSGGAIKEMNKEQLYKSQKHEYKRLKAQLNELKY